MGVPVSLHGRKFAIDAESGATIVDGLTNGLTTAASTGTTIPPRGLTAIASTGALAFTLAAPVADAVKTIVSTVVSTAVRTVTLASGTFLSTAGSSQNRATFNNIGQALQLEALSTSLWAVTGNVGSVSLTTA